MNYRFRPGLGAGVVDSRLSAFTSPTPYVSPGSVQTADLSPDNITRCTSGWYWLNPFSCWGLSPDAWAAAAALPPIPNNAVAPAAPASALVFPYNVTPDEAQAASDAAIAAQQAATLNYVQQNVPDNPLGTAPCEWMNISCSTWAIIGVVGFFFVTLAGGRR